jgi:hypothetical protein
MNIMIATSAQVDATWPTFAERLQESCQKSGGDLSSGDLWQMCRSGQAFLVLIYDEAGFIAALIMQFQNWSGKQILRILALVGDDMKQWLSMAKGFVTRMAADGGAKSIVTDGRVGWTRVFPTAKKLRVVYEVEL